MDSDGDGILDPADGAPLEAENVNGFRDDDGVPELILAERPSGVILFDAGLYVPEPVLFAEGTAKDITKSSVPVLRDLLSILKEFPDVRVRLVGHADAAEQVANPALSQLRAQMVADLLMRSGIDAGRIEVAGSRRGPAGRHGRTQHAR